MNLHRKPKVQNNWTDPSGSGCCKTGTSIQKSAFTGTIRAVNQSSIQAQVSATATSVNAQVGDNVAKGQILVRLNNQDNAARLAQARANLASTQAQANQARNMMQRKSVYSTKALFLKLNMSKVRLTIRPRLKMSAHSKPMSILP